MFCPWLYNQCLGLGGSVFRKLVGSIPNQYGSNYHIVKGIFFTSSLLLQLLKEGGIAAIGTVRMNHVEKAPLKPVKEKERLEKGFSVVVTENNFNITLVWWKDNKAVTVVSTLYGQWRKHKWPHMALYLQWRKHKCISRKSIVEQILSSHKIFISLTKIWEELAT